MIQLMLKFLAIASLCEPATFAELRQEFIRGFHSV
jgi:hypothetical protein